MLKSFFLLLFGKVLFLHHPLVSQRVWWHFCVVGGGGWNCSCGLWFLLGFATFLPLWWGHSWFRFSDCPISHKWHNTSLWLCRWHSNHSMRGEHTKYVTKHYCDFVWIYPFKLPCFPHELFHLPRASLWTWRSVPEERCKMHLWYLKLANPGFI